MVDRQAANVAAFLFFVLILVGGAYLAGKEGPTFDPPEKTTSVVEAVKGAGTGKKTRATGSKPQGQGAKTRGRKVTVETPTGEPTQKTTVTVEEGSRSLVERTLGNSGLIGLQAALVLLAAFLGAALVQRALMGDYSVKVGNFELGALQEAASKTTVSLAAEVVNLQEANKELGAATEAQKKQLESLNESLGKAQSGSAALARIIAEQGLGLSEAESRIASVEDRLEHGNG